MRYPPQCPTPVRPLGRRGAGGPEPYIPLSYQVKGRSSTNWVCTKAARQALTSRALNVIYNQQLLRDFRHCNASYHNAKHNTAPQNDAAQRNTTHSNSAKRPSNGETMKRNATQRNAKQPTTALSSVTHAPLQPLSPTSLFSPLPSGYTNREPPAPPPLQLATALLYRTSLKLSRHAMTCQHHAESVQRSSRPETYKTCGAQSKRVTKPEKKCECPPLPPHPATTYPPTPRRPPVPPRPRIPLPSPPPYTRPHPLQPTNFL